MLSHRLSIFLLLIALTLAACGAPAAAPATGPSDEVIQELVRAKFPLPLVSVTVQEKSACASAEELWVARVERIGNLNYPDDARRQDLHGQLVLTVGLDRDGSVKSIDIIQPSGHKILDDAAIRIVNLSAPFNALPKDGEAVDELYITRTWQFLPGNILRNR